MTEVKCLTVPIARFHVCHNDFSSKCVADKSFEALSKSFQEAIENIPAGSGVIVVYTNHLDSSCNILGNIGTFTVYPKE